GPAGRDGRPFLRRAVLPPRAVVPARPDPLVRRREAPAEVRDHRGRRPARPRPVRDRPHPTRLNRSWFRIRTSGLPEALGEPGSNGRPELPRRVDMLRLDVAHDREYGGDELPAKSGHRDLLDRRHAPVDVGAALDPEGERQTDGRVETRVPYPF